MTPERVKEIIADISQRLKTGELKIVSNDGYRYYTDTLTETLNIPLTTAGETAELYERLFLNPLTEQANLPIDLFDRLSHFTLFIGPPDTGKTYKALQIAKDCGITPLFKMCNEDFTLVTLLKDFILVDGKPEYKESLTLTALTGTDRAIIVLDEINTISTGAIKSLQPLFDDTSTHFEYQGKVYKKNPNCKIIGTLNDKDKGISILPDAILSRAACEWFEPTPLSMISNWTKTPIEWVQLLFDLYKALGLLSIFGTRQIKLLHKKTTSQIKNHLYAMCAMKKIDTKTIETLQVTQLVNKLTVC